MAQLYFKYGAMGSSKTANALMTRFNYEERGQKTLLVKPRLDTRDGDHMVVSRPASTLTRCSSSLSWNCSRTPASSWTRPSF